MVAFYEENSHHARKGVEDSEFIYPYYRFQEEGYKVEIVAPKAKTEYIGKRGGAFLWLKRVFVLW